MFNRKNIVLKGIAASPGIAIGEVFLFEVNNFCIIYREIPINARELEKKRLNDAIEKTRAELNLIYKRIDNALGENYAQVVDVHLLILDDPAMRRDVDKLIEDGVNAEYALFKVIDKIIRSFEAIEDNYFNERKLDIQDVCEKIIGNLVGRQERTVKILNENSIVVAHNLPPADTISIRGRSFKGFATDIGGKTSHTAILAQGLEIPAVVGLRTISSQTRTGDIIIVDGNKGEIILNPDQEIINKYKKEYAVQFAKKKELEKLKELPPETIDNHKVLIYANIDNPDEVQSILNNGATGIGLYRTEYIYIDHKTMPSEEEHFEKYREVVTKMSPYPTVIRTLDLGGDKFAKESFLNVKREENPFLGLRAIRFCLKHPDIFIDQIRGILRASNYGEVRLMYPMISGLDEIHKTNRILEEVKQDLIKENIKFDKNIKVGAMIEVPSAAILIGAIAKEVDFVSIGTNDLIQYALAVDRGNENVADLYDPLHPAILRYIKMIIDESHKAGISVTMCGEMAGNPYYTPILLGLGLDGFSVSSTQLLEIKKVIRNISHADAKRITRKVLNCSDREEISKIMGAFE